MGDHLDVVADVVEDQQRVGEHQPRLGQPEVVVLDGGQALEVRDRLVAEVANGAAVEQRQARDGDRLVAPELLLDDEQRVAVLVGERLDAVRLGADERVAPDLLAALDGLKQERVRPPRDLEVRRHGRLEVGADLTVDRDDVPLAGRGEGADFVEAGRRDAGGGGGHRAAPVLRAEVRRCEAVRHHHARPVVESRRVDALYWRCTSVPPRGRSARSAERGFSASLPGACPKEKTIARGDGPRGATQFRAPPRTRGRDTAVRARSGHGRRPARGGAMPWAWITAPTPSVPTDPLDRVDGGRSGRDSRVHSAAADRRRASTLPRLSEPRGAAYSSRSPSVRLYASGRIEATCGV